MPEFKKKACKFQHKGIQLNRSIDTIPEEQVAFAKNVRVNQQGTITERPGRTLWATLSTPAYTHSLARLNNFNTGLVAFSAVEVIGADAGMWVGDTAAHLATANNPIYLPPVGTAAPSKTSLSGSPLTMVDMAPVGTNIGWKYIGDANLNYSVGYYPGDTTVNATGNNLGMARALSMGMTPPVTPAVVPVIAAGGLLTGDYQWIYAYRNKFTGARSNPSSPTRVTLAAPALTCTAQKATLTVPNTPVNPQDSPNADPNIVIDIYRYGGTIFDWRYVGTAPSGGGTHTDNVPDTAILTAAAPPQVTDPVTGVTRFNLFRPFVIQDNAVYSIVANPGTITVDATTGIYTLTADVSSGTLPKFDLNWLPGSVISINNNAWTIYQVISTSVIEIAENPGANLVTATTYAWATLTGTLKAGAPLPHIWGPYGTGSGGAFIFGCGGANSDAGTLYWCNGNDPDSTDLVNSLVVTSPSEPLRGGCIYDGTPFVWSTERMFRIYPGIIAGQFTVQEIAGGKGLWAEYSLTVQSNGISDQSVSWVGKDGIYDFSASGGLQSLTDRDLYPFFPHDNQVGLPLSSLLPSGIQLLIGGTAITAPSFTAGNMKYHRLTWFQGELFYDFPAAASTYFTLVYDSKQANGWVSFDSVSSAATPIARGIEIAASNMRLGSVNVIYDYTGTSDNETPIVCQVISRQDDCGDPRAEKLFGDLLVDVAAGTAANAGVRVYPVIDYGLFTTGTYADYANIARAQTAQDLTATGLGYLSKAFGVAVTWTAGSTPATIYGYDFSYVPKPEITALRATDKTDDGYNGAKYLRGVCIECNTYATDRTVKVLVDDVVLTTLTVNSSTNTQAELPFAFVPYAGSEFQLQPTDANTWELFTVRWTWDKYPDITGIHSPWLDIGTTKPKYVRGFSVPISAAATPLTFTVLYDGTSTYTTAAVTPLGIGIMAKWSGQFSFNPPILAHQLKLNPSSAARVWYDEIKWDAEEWPELATFYGPVENLGTSGAKYLRGFELPMDTNGVAVAMNLTYDVQLGTSGFSITQAFPAVTTTALAKNVFPYTPNTPVIAHEFQLSSSSQARFWYPEVKWDFEPWPEYDTGRSPWMDAGTPAAKFMQGLIITTDTASLPVTFDLVYDGGVVTIGPFTTLAGRKTPVPYSFPIPFIAHEFQLSPNSNCRFWYEEIKWVWEPVPELVTSYITQPTDHDLPGYHYLFDAYIAYIGSSDAPVFSVVTEYGTDTYTLPVSNGVYARAYLLLNPRKAKWRSYSIISSGGIRLFLKDCEVRAKNWTDKGQYPSSFQSMHPFGDQSRIHGALI